MGKKSGVAVSTLTTQEEWETLLEEEVCAHMNFMYSQVYLQGMLTLVEVYTKWAGTCGPMSPILTKMKVDLQVKQEMQKIQEKLQFTFACSDTVKVA